MYFKCTCDDFIYTHTHTHTHTHIHTYIHTHVPCGMISKIIDTAITSQLLFFFPLVRMLKISQQLLGTQYCIHFCFQFPAFGPGQRSVCKMI